MEDSVLTEEDIEWEVWRLRTNGYGGPSWIRSEHLWGWLREARKAEVAAEAAAETAGETDVEETVTKELLHWKKVVVLDQAAFREERLVEEATWQAVILIPKGVGTNVA